MLRAMTGRSPKGITAQGNTLCLSSLTNWRAVSAKGASEMLGRPSFCSFRAQVSSFNITQGAAPGLYSYWAFSPSLQLFMFAATILIVCCDVPFALTMRRRNLYPLCMSKGYVISDSFCNIEAYHESLTCGDKCCIFASSVREMTDLHLSY